MEAGAVSRGCSVPTRALQAALALHFAYYNFCRIHGKLRVTPAIKAGITDHLWELAELLA
jgi:hypothetical protein